MPVISELGESHEEDSMSANQENPTLHFRKRLLESSIPKRTDMICSYLRKRIAVSCGLSEDGISTDINLSQLDQSQAENQNLMGSIRTIVRDEIGLLLSSFEMRSLNSINSISKYIAKELDPPLPPKRQVVDIYEKANWQWPAILILTIVRDIAYGFSRLRIVSA